MASLVGEKRKNEEHYERREQRRIPGWLILLVGFALGIIFTLSMSIGRNGTITAVYSEAIPDNHMAQATLLISEATLNAQAAQNNLILPQDDPLLATATALMIEATQAAVNP